MKVAVELEAEAKRHRVSVGTLVTGLLSAWQELGPQDQQRRMGVPVLGMDQQDQSEGPVEVDGLVMGTWLQKNL